MEGQDRQGSRNVSNHIGTLNEKPLHAALKQWYAQAGDLTEVSVDRFTVDIVRGDMLIEIQTRNLSAIKRKLTALVERHPVRLVYPIAQDKWIVRLSKNGKTVLGRRKSPKRGTLELVFEELVFIPQLLAHPSFSLEVLLIEEEETRRYDSSRNWRCKGWVTHQRKLLQIMERRLFETPADMQALIPASLVEPFTTTQLAEAMERPLWLAQKMAYCLREMGAIVVVGKHGRHILYARALPRVV
jgi:hypothetical protein